MVSISRTDAGKSAAVTVAAFRQPVPIPTRKNAAIPAAIPTGSDFDVFIVPPQSINFQRNTSKERALKPTKARA
jgi:hypothetical protein